MLHRERSLWFGIGRVVAAGAAGLGWLFATAWGAPNNRLNLNENPAYARRPSHTVCNPAGIQSLADPQEDRSFLAACDLDCVQCAQGKCSAGTSSRCELAAASREAEQESTPWNAAEQFGPNLYVMTDAGEVPQSLVMSLPEEMQIMVVEAPDGAELYTKDGQVVRVIMRVDQDGPLPPTAPAGS